jgi:hypothetical protein
MPPHYFGVMSGYEGQESSKSIDSIRGFRLLLELPKVQRLAVELTIFSHTKHPYGKK